MKDIKAGETYVLRTGRRCKIVSVEGFDKGFHEPLCSGKKLIALIQPMRRWREADGPHFEEVAEAALAAIDTTALIGKRLWKLGEPLDASEVTLGTCTPRELVGTPAQYAAEQADELAAAMSRRKAYNDEMSHLSGTVERAGAILGMPLDVKFAHADGERTIVMTAAQWEAILGRLEATAAPLALGAL